MRAWQVQVRGEPVEAMRLVERDAPEPGPGELRVKVTAAGIGLPDVLMCRHTYPLTPPAPFTPGQEAAGVVTAAGPDVEAELGSTVMGVTGFIAGNGSFAEECIMPAGSAFVVPPGLSPTHAAGFWIPHLTAWVGLVDRGRVAPAEWLAVLGAAGGSGIAALQLGRALGARTIAVVGGEDRAEYCRALGVDEVVDHREGPVAPRLREITGGAGVDVIYDPVGGAPAEDAAAALARYGRLLAVGFASGAWPRIPAHDLVVANASLVGVFAGGYSRAELDAIHSELSALVAAGSLVNAVTTEVPFDDLPAGLQRLADRRVIGKMVMLP